MTDVPDRWKNASDYSEQEHLEALQAERQGQTYRAETSEYQQARIAALRDAGLEDEADELERGLADSPAVEDLTVDEHLAAIRRAS